MSALSGMTQTARDPNKKIQAGFLPGKDPLDLSFADVWYPRPDSNRHASRRGILNPLRLPFRHLGTAPI
jgi:hypothetical protein